jgi:hypothetical protein
VSALEIGVGGCNILGVCIIGCVYWKLVYVAIYVWSVTYRDCVFRFGVFGCKCRQRPYRECVLEICVSGCKSRQCAL